jgi:hypothetical protein
VARGDAEPHVRGQLGDREAPVLLQCSKDFAIQRIHEVYSSTKQRLGGNS